MTDLASRETSIRLRVAAVATPDHGTDSAAASLAGALLSVMTPTEFLRSNAPETGGLSARAHRNLTLQTAPNGFHQTSEGVYGGQPEWSGWDDTMADVAAHLMSAHELLSGLAGTSLYASPAETHAIHVSHSIRAVLVSLDECTQVDGNGSYLQDPSQ
jgi:hypothetical protein